MRAKRHFHMVEVIARQKRIVRSPAKDATYAMSSSRSGGPGVASTNHSIACDIINVAITQIHQNTWARLPSNSPTTLHWFMFPRCDVNVCFGHINFRLSLTQYEFRVVSVTKLNTFGAESWITVHCIGSYVGKILGCHCHLSLIKDTGLKKYLNWTFCLCFYYFDFKIFCFKKHKILS